MNESVYILLDTKPEKRWEEVIPTDYIAGIYSTNDIAHQAKLKMDNPADYIITVKPIHKKPSVVNIGVIENETM